MAYVHISCPPRYAGRRTLTPWDPRARQCNEAAGGLSGFLLAPPEYLKGLAPMRALNS